MDNGLVKDRSLKLPPDERARARPRRQRAPRGRKRIGGPTDQLRFVQNSSPAGSPSTVGRRMRPDVGEWRAHQSVRPTNDLSVYAQSHALPLIALVNCDRAFDDLPRALAHILWRKMCRRSEQPNRQVQATDVFGLSFLDLALSSVPRCQPLRALQR